MILVYYLIIINVLAFVLYGIDKRKAVEDKFRIPESRLLLVAFLGGEVGAWLGMKVFHHKTKKNKFRITIPVLLVLFIIISGLCLYGNYHLVTEQYDYCSVNVPAEMDGFTIVQVSDLHNQIFGFGESVLLKKIRECEPDIIVVTGDAVDSTHTNYGITKSFFKGAVEIAPVYYISGNHEKWLWQRNQSKYDNYIQEIEGYGVNYIDDEIVEGDGYKLVGVSELSLGNQLDLYSDEIDGNNDETDDYQEGGIGAGLNNDEEEESSTGSNTNEEDESSAGLNTKEEDKLVILLAHEPEYIESFVDTGADLVFTGHNHGGQIRIPGKGGLVSADFRFFPELCEGEHFFGDTTMIISRGLGNSLFPVRINNDPQLVKVVLAREEHKLMHLYMPDVVGRTEEEATTKLKELGFFNVAVIYEKSDTVESGRVIRQSIPPETTVSTEFEIILYISE